VDRSNTVSRIAALCRANPGTALWALGYLTLNRTQEELDDLLEGCEEHAEVLTNPRHYQAYLERWGRIPGP